MAIIISDNIQNHSPKPLDDWRGVWENGVFRPYSSIEEANFFIPAQYRYTGLTVLILDTENPSGFSEWWYTPDPVPVP